MSSAPKTTSTTIPGPVGELEALIDTPADALSVRRVALICHPHPLFGGSMTNKVTHILARTYNELGAPAVRFNFRGVGRSAGVHDDGRGEVDDTIAVLDWTQQQWPNAELWLAGFSFGAAMALHASLRHSVACLVTVAPALRWLTQLEEIPACPWLIVQGDRDELVNVDEVRNWSAKWSTGLPRSPEVSILSGGEHFFHGRLNELRDVVKEWLSRRSADA